MYIVYQAEVTREDNKVDTYVGLAATSFKDRYSNHTSSFRTRNPKNSTTLSKYIWGLQDQNIGYQVKWKILSSASPFNHVTNRCRLCVREKYFIIFQPEMATLNNRNEIAGHCLHKTSQLLDKNWNFFWNTLQTTCSSKSKTNFILVQKLVPRG